MALTDGQLSLLHDHYKETFSLIRDREGQRDRLLLWLFAFYALLIVEVQYPANAHGVLGSLSLAGNTINLELLPLSLLLDASWVFMAAFVLKYCQIAKAVERQYDYLHLLEDRVSGAMGDAEVYRREGRAYLTRYPRLLNWAWLSYTIVFPTAVLLATTYLYVVEIVELRYGWVSKSFDGMLASSVIVSVVLYRFFPEGNERPPRGARVPAGCTDERPTISPERTAERDSHEG